MHKIVHDQACIAGGFERAAGAYDDFAVLQRRVAEEMLSRLELVTLVPQRILDAGCGTGYCSRDLKARYRKAQVVGLDLAAGMLQRARQQRGWFSRQHFVQGNAASLPLAAQSIDLVVSNLMLQWCDPSAVFSEFRRVLSSEGLLMFSSFGPDTLAELRQSWRDIDDRQHVIDFADMHDLGDALLMAGFREPVMDVDRYTLSYADVLALLRDLHGIGSRNIANDRARGMMGRGQLRALERAYRRFADHAGRLPASYEVVYGHAWSGGQVVAGQRAAGIPVEQLRRSPR
jgi:malonyl-CoA O-methyltransferase